MDKISNENSTKNFELNDQNNNKFNNNIVIDIANKDDNDFSFIEKFLERLSENKESEFLKLFGEKFIYEFLFGEGHNKEAIEKSIMSSKELCHKVLDDDELYDFNANFEADVNSNSQEESKEEERKKKDFIFSILTNPNILDSVDEDTMLACVKYLFDTRNYKKCVNLCL